MDEKIFCFTQLNDITYLLSDLDLDYNKPSEYYKNKIKVIEKFGKNVLEFGKENFN